MATSKFLLIFGLVSLVIGVLQTFDVRYSIGYHFPYYDLSTHGLGGAWVVFIAYILCRLFFKSLASRHVFFVLSVFLLVTVAISWEVFEVWQGVARYENNYWNDTLIDLAADMIGAIIAYLFLRKEFK